MRKQVMKMVTQTLFCTTSFFISRNAIFTRSLSINRNLSTYGVIKHGFNRFHVLHGNKQLHKSGIVTNNSKDVRCFMSTSYSCNNEDSEMKIDLNEPTAESINNNDPSKNSKTLIINDNQTIEESLHITTEAYTETYTENNKSENSYDKNTEKYVNYLPSKNIQGKIKKEVKQKTKDWAENVIMQFSLCPFASKPIKEKTLKIVVNFATDEKGMLVVKCFVFNNMLTFSLLRNGISYY